jgi:hypothetical protein
MFRCVELRRYLISYLTITAGRWRRQSMTDTREQEPRPVHTIDRAVRVLVWLYIIGSLAGPLLVLYALNSSPGFMALQLFDWIQRGYDELRQAWR